MPTFVIQIKADTNGVSNATSRVERDLEKMKNKALDANKAIRQIFGIFAIREMLTGLYGLVDGYTSLRNKLSVVAKDQANLNGIIGATFKVAQETRSSWASTAQMFSRMALNSKQLGVSQKELIDFTRSLNQAIIVGGATATEASAGLLQLSQGMASGAVKGDELRAVMEQLPTVADVISKKFGVTRGQLRALGTAGKITGKDIILAFKDSAKEIEEAFKKTTPTISQGFEMIKNSATKFFGEAGTGSGVLSSLATVLKFVADNMDTIGKVILGVGQAFLGLYIIKGIIGLFRALWVVVATNPLTALVMAITAGILLIRQFGDDLDTSRKVMTDFGEKAVTIGDYLRGIWSILKELGAEIWDFLKTAWSALTDAFSDGLDASGIDLSLENVLKMIAAFVLSATAILKRAKEIFVLVFGGIPGMLAEKFDAAFQGITDGIVAVVNKMITIINRLAETVKSVRAMSNLPELRENKAIDADLTKQIQAKGRSVTDINDRARSGQATAGDLVLRDQLLGQMKILQTQRDVARAKVEALQQEFKPVDRLSPVDFDRQGVKGASDAVKQDFKDLMDGIQGEVAAGLEKIDDAADQAARKRAHEAANVSGYVGTDPLAKEAKKQADQKEHDKMIRQLDALLKKSNEIREAEMQMVAAEKFLARGDVIEELAKRGITAGTVISDLQDKLYKQLKPLEAWTNEQIDLTAAMKGTNEEFEHNRAVLEVMNSMYDKGLLITQAVVDQIERVVTAQEQRRKEWELEKNLLETLTGPQQHYRDNLAALNRLMANGRLTQQKYAQGFQMITAEFERSNDEMYNKWLEKQAMYDPMKSGWYKGVDAIKTQMLDLSSAVSNAMTESLTAVEDFILTAADTGALAFTNMIETIAKALDRLALKIIEQYIMLQVMNSLTPGAGSVPGVSNVTKSISEGRLDVLDAGGHAYGGTWIAPGRGSGDSVMMQALVHPGERVDFTPAGQSYGGAVARMADASATSMARSSAPANQNSAAVAAGMKDRLTVKNIIDRGELLSALETPDGDEVVVNVVKRNAGAIRGVLQK